MKNNRNPEEFLEVEKLSVFENFNVKGGISVSEEIDQTKCKCKCKCKEEN